jgi:hypothetical protein
MLSINIMKIKAMARESRFAALLTLTLVAILYSTQPGRAQGCVAARGAGQICSAAAVHPGETLPPASGFQASVNYRWFKSDRHFVGDEEQTQRQAEGSEVINRSHFIDVGVAYAIDPRWSVSVTFPFTAHDRSQVVRSNDTARTILGRFSTQAGGLGDIRFGVNGWILNPSTPRKGNVLLGLTVAAPTGEDDARDTFQVYNAATKTVVPRDQTVDQSIQPGTGGWGITLELYSFYSLARRWNLYVNGAYTFTPEEMNGVPTYRTNNPYESIMSITDAYFGRAGVEFALWPKHGLVLSLGGRIEGVPVWDAIGGSDGFRRPGFSIGIEPGLAAMLGRWSLGLYAPVALYRNRERSVPDMQWSEASGVSRHGDAAFADFAILFSVAHQF